MTSDQRSDARPDDLSGDGGATGPEVLRRGVTRRRFPVASELDGAARRESTGPLPTTGPAPMSAAPDRRVTAAMPRAADTAAVPAPPFDSLPTYERDDLFDLPEIVPADRVATSEPAQIVRRGVRPRVRRVTRVVRHIDTWSVFKVALVLHMFMYVVCLTAGVFLWQVADSTGTIDNIERFFESFGWETFELRGGEVYHNAWIAGLFLVIGLTGLAVLAATLFNLITDLVGGVRVSVLEEEVVARDPASLPESPWQALLERFRR